MLNIQSYIEQSKQDFDKIRKLLSRFEGQFKFSANLYHVVVKHMPTQAKHQYNIIMARTMCTTRRTTAIKYLATNNSRRIRTAELVSKKPKNKKINKKSKSNKKATTAFRINLRNRDQVRLASRQQSVSKSSAKSKSKDRKLNKNFTKSTRTSFRQQKVGVQPLIIETSSVIITKQKKKSKSKPKKEISRIKASLRTARSRSKSTKPIVTEVKKKRKIPLYIKIKKAAEKNAQLSKESGQCNQVERKQKESSLHDQADNNVYPGDQIQIRIRGIIKQEYPACEANQSKITKMKSKTIAQLQRIQKINQNRIYLIDAERKQNQWHFKLMNSKRKFFQVKISNNITCSCLDSRLKTEICPHISFLFTKVVNCQQLLSQLKYQKKISEELYSLLDQNLCLKLSKRLVNEKRTEIKNDHRSQGQDNNCVICFMEMDGQNDKLWECPSCNKLFHLQCFSVWKKQKNTCPLCFTDVKEKNEETQVLSSFCQLQQQPV